MNAYTVKFEGVEVKVKLADWENSSLVESYVSEMKSALSCSPVRVVGLDIISRSTSDCRRNISCRGSLVLCLGATATPTCMIVHLPTEFNDSINNIEGLSEIKKKHSSKVPEALIKFLEDSSICFIGSTCRPSSLVRGAYHYQGTTAGVTPWDLAARVLKNPTLTGMSLAELSPKVGVHYDQHEDPAKEKYMWIEIEVDSKNPTIFTQDQVKIALHHAYAYYKIGHKLLSTSL